MKRKLFERLKYRKVIKYLESKEESQYNNLDKVLKYYCDGELQKEMEEQNFSDFEFFPKINKKKGNWMQIYCSYFNLVIIIDLVDEKIDTVVYLAGMSSNELDNCSTSYRYADDFTVENFFENFSDMLKNDNRLKKGWL